MRFKSYLNGAKIKKQTKIVNFIVITLMIRLCFIMTNFRFEYISIAGGL